MGSGDLTLDGPAQHVSMPASRSATFAPICGTLRDVCIQPPLEVSRIAGHGGAADALAGQPEGTSAGSRLGGDVLSIQAMTAPCR